MEILLRDEAATMRFGENLGLEIKAGSLILLTGSMGMGKTTLTKAIAKGIGCQQAILSPTFSILHVFHTNAEQPDLQHLDFYSVKNLEHLEELGIYDVFARQDAITIVEWWDLWPQVCSGYPAIQIHLEPHGTDGRILIVRNPVEGKACLKNQNWDKFLSNLEPSA